MDVFFRIVGLTAIAVILIPLIPVREKAFGTMLGMAACALVISAGIAFLRPVIEFLHELDQMGNLQTEWMEILLKAVGIGVLSEIVVLLCVDSGNNSLAQSLRLCSAAVILYLALPVFQSLLTLIREILEGL